MGVQAEDIDGDGYVDLFLTHLRRESNTFYWGQGKGLFTDATHRTGLAAPSFPRTGFGVAFFDGDLDGDLDLVVANGRVRRGTHLLGATEPKGLEAYAEPDQYFEHIGASDKGRWGLRFVERSAEAGRSFVKPHIGRGLCVGDYDGDGDLDVLVTSNGANARLLRNQVPRRGHWLSLRVLRRGGKGFAYGAAVEVTADGIVWKRRVQPAFSYLSSSDPRVHLGVGKSLRCHVEVRWPDGTKRELETDVDRVVTIRPDGETSSG